jgi:hypothetical protein
MTKSSLGGVPKNSPAVCGGCGASKLDCGRGASKLDCGRGASKLDRGCESCEVKLDRDGSKRLGGGGPGGGA